MIVPFPQGQPKPSPGPQPTQTELLMALAEMHSMGRLAGAGDFYKGATPIFGGEPEHDDAALLERTIRETGSVRIHPGSPSTQEFLKNLPKDIEREDLNEFGEGHDNNTIILKTKSKPPLVG